MLKVLSLNCYTLGHSTYQNILEQTFKTFGNEIDFESLHLTDYYSKDTAGRILHYILRKRIPGSGNTDYDFYRLRLESANSFFAYRYLQRRLNDLIPDVLHIHTQSITYLMDSILAQIPSIISIDMTYANLARIHKFPSKITYYPLKLLEKKSFNAANHIICCSNWARESVIKDYKIPPNKVSTIYYGMPIKSFESIKNHNEYNESKIKLLFVRNDFNRKGGTDLISVFLKHFSESCELHLVTNQHIDEKLPDSIKLGSR